MPHGERVFCPASGQFNSYGRTRRTMMCISPTQTKPGRSMSSRLDRRSDWEKLAAQCSYRVEEMARRCKISPRQLQRHFLVLFGQTPKHWLDELRARAAADEILRGELVKTASGDFCFKQASHFTKFFKR